MKTPAISDFILYSVILWFINIFRHISYYLNREKGVETYIDSFESLYLHSRSKYVKDILKDLLLSFVFIYLYLTHDLPFFIFGMIVDSIFDVYIAFCGNFYNKVVKSRVIRFILREMIIPYIVFASIFSFLSVDVSLFIFASFAVIFLEFALLYLRYRKK